MWSEDVTMEKLRSHDCRRGHCNWRTGSREGQPGMQQTWSGEAGGDQVTGWGTGQPPSLSHLVALQMWQDPAWWQEKMQEAGGEPSGNIQGPRASPARAWNGSGQLHQEPQSEKPVRSFSSCFVDRRDCSEWLQTVTSSRSPKPRSQNGSVGHKFRRQGAPGLLF